MFKKVVTYIRNKEGKIIRKTIIIRKSNELKCTGTSESLLKAQVKDHEMIHQ